MTMILPAHHILPLAHLRRLRLLNGKGRVLVRPGQMVEATDVIAEAPAPGQHLLLDVRKALGVQRVSEAERLIERQVGERVEKGDILAQTRGLFARILRAPVAGQVVAIYKGRFFWKRNLSPIVFWPDCRVKSPKFFPNAAQSLKPTAHSFKGFGAISKAITGCLPCSPKLPMHRSKPIC